MEGNTSINLRDSESQRIYSQEGYTNTATSHSDDEDLRKYKAWETSRNALLSLELRYNRDASTLIDYVPFIIQLESHSHISIECPMFSCVIVIEGQNIQELKNDLRTRKVNWIQQFYPEKFDQPSDGKPKITKIEIIKAGERE